MVNACRIFAYSEITFLQALDLLMEQGMLLNLMNLAEVAVDASGNVYVADVYNAKIEKLHQLRCGKALCRLFTRLCRWNGIFLAAKFNS
jgi:hypothetical protein